MLPATSTVSICSPLCTNVYIAGNIAKHFSAWQTLTSDPYILRIVKGYQLEFCNPPCQALTPRAVKLSCKETDIATTEINKLLTKGVIRKATHVPGEFISTIFTRPKKKKDGSHRLILNLKKLNEHIEYHHFKMDSLPNALQLMKPNCWMAVLDLKDAYYSVPIRTEDRKYLRFEHEGQLYEFVCLPNGLSSAPRIFTKLLKPALAKLREDGVLLVIYIDDIILFADDPQTLVIFIQRAITLLQSLGFTIHSDKSQLVPSQRVNFLGFILDSVVITVSMKSDKADKAKSAILQLLRTEQPLIREVASVVGQMVSCFPGVKYGPLYYRALENDKTDALKTNGWNLDDRMLISDIAKKDMSWWLSNIDNDPCPVRPMKYKLTLKCDSSLEGWGSVIENSSLAANGRWSHSESMCHINYLEIKAVLFGLQSLCSDLTNCNIKVLSDNQTAVSYLRNMGGTHSRDCNEIARETLMWCKDRGISLAVTHLPGKLNVEADLASRHFHDDTEWSLDTHVYNSLITKWGNPGIDLFASRLNAKLPCYAAWKPDPCAHFIDAFTLDWSVFKLVYCFPPFSVIGKVLQKIIFSETTAILVLPDWPTQFWYPRVMSMLVAPLHRIKLQKSTLTLPHDVKNVHPLYPKLRLIGCLVSGNPSS